MKRRKIVDAHHHLWDLSSNQNYPWLQERPLRPVVSGDISKIAHDYLPADYRGDSANYEVVKSVHIDAVSADPVAETRWLQEIADKHGFPNAIVARAELHRPDVENVLASHRTFENVRGIRHILNWHRDPALTFVNRSDFLTDHAWRMGFKLLKKYGLSFDLQLYPSQMIDAAVVAAENPDTLIIVNHTGMPLVREEAGLHQWRMGMRVLSQRENVVTKISGLGMVDWFWTEESIREFVLETIAMFGAERVMFGSNFPVDKIYSSFDALYGAFERVVAGFSDTEQDAMFRSNALKYYRL